MDNASYIALSKQMAQFRQMDVIANNVANANTTGFRADRMLFTDYLVNEENPAPIAFTQDIGMFRDTRTGALEQTGNTFDLAIMGDAYFVVSTPLGERYTKAGNFKLNNERMLVTAQGFPVLDSANQPIQFQEEDRVFSFTEEGFIDVDEEERGALNLVRFDNEQALQRTSENLFATDEAPIPVNPLAEVREAVVAQGMLETSNVQPVVEITNMITTMRRVGGTSRFIEAVHELQRKAIQAYAKTQG